MIFTNLYQWLFLKDIWEALNELCSKVWFLATVTTPTPHDLTRESHRVSASSPSAKSRRRAPRFSFEAAKSRLSFVVCILLEMIYNNVVAATATTATTTTTRTRMTNALQWRHNGRDGISNHRSHHCLLNRLFTHRSKKITKLRVTGLCIRGIHRWPLNSPHKWPVAWKTSPFDDVIIGDDDDDNRNHENRNLILINDIEYDGSS